MADTSELREKIAREIDVQAFAIWNHDRGGHEYTIRSKASQAARQEVALEKADAILALPGLQAEAPEDAEVTELKRQVHHWKANHDHIKERIRLLLDRPDLPGPRKNILKYWDDKVAELECALRTSQAETQAPAPVLTAEAIWLVFSHEHGAYWRPNRCGYTTHVEAAGRYTFAEADSICRNARSPSADDSPYEVVVPSPELIDRLTQHKSAS